MIKGSEFFKNLLCRLYTLLLVKNLRQQISIKKQGFK